MRSAKAAAYRRNRYNVFIIKFDYRYYRRGSSRLPCLKVLKASDFTELPPSELSFSAHAINDIYKTFLLLSLILTSMQKFQRTLASLLPGIAGSSGQCRNAKPCTGLLILVSSFILRIKFSYSIFRFFFPQPLCRRFITHRSNYESGIKQFFMESGKSWPSIRDDEWSKVFGMRGRLPGRETWLHLQELRFQPASCINLRHYPFVSQFDVLLYNSIILIK